MHIVVAHLCSWLKMNIFFKLLVLLCCYAYLYSVPILIIKQKDGAYPHLQQSTSNLQKLGPSVRLIACSFGRTFKLKMLSCVFVYIFVSNVLLNSDKITYYFYSFILLKDILMCLSKVSSF